jgi:hypothetical protein
MEEIIYAEIVDRLTDAAVIAYIQGLQYEEPKDVKWFTDQVEAALAAAADNNKDYPLATPGILIEFGRTVYDKKRGTFRQHGSGTVTIHVVQTQIGLDGQHGAETHDEFKDLVGYPKVILDLLDGFKLPSCTAKLVLTDTQKDHKNRPLRDDQFTLSWEGTRIVPSGIPE